MKAKRPTKRTVAKRLRTRAMLIAKLTKPKT